MRIRPASVTLIVYLLLLMLPIYWMLNMSLRTNADILGTFSLVPTTPTLANYVRIFTDPAWYGGTNPLAGPENDANSFSALARNLGFESTVYLTRWPLRTERRRSPILSRRFGDDPPWACGLPVPPPGGAQSGFADFDENGDVDGADLGILLGAWTE